MPSRPRPLSNNVLAGVEDIIAATMDAWPALNCASERSKSAPGEHLMDSVLLADLNRHGDLRSGPKVARPAQPLRAEETRMRQRGDYLIIGLTLIGLAALLLAYLCSPWPVPGPFPVHIQPGQTEAPRHVLAAILFVVLILLLIEDTVTDAVDRAQDDHWRHNHRRRQDRPASGTSLKHRTPNS